MTGDVGLTNQTLLVNFTVKPLPLRPVETAKPGEPTRIAQMEEIDERLAATGRSRTEPRLGIADILSLLDCVGTSKFDGVEWLLDWVETRREDPR